jgi:hypothetical protein
MQLLCEYNKEEILKVVAEHAGRTLPEDSDGVLRAIQKDDGNIEVFFLPNNKNSMKN